MNQSRVSLLFGIGMIYLGFAVSTATGQSRLVETVPEIVPDHHFISSSTTSQPSMWLPQTGHSGSGVQWIWDEPGAAAGSQGQDPRYFRTSFDLTSLPTSVQLQITADNEFIAYLNGTTVGSDDDWKGVQTYETLKSLLIPGKNVLCIQAKNQDGPAGLIALLRLEFGDGSVKWAAAGPDTKVTRTLGGGNWLDPQFDDTSWNQASPLGAPGESGQSEWDSEIGKASFSSTHRRVRDLASQLLLSVYNSPDQVAANALTGLVHLALDHSSLNLVESLDNDSAPKLMDRTVELASSYVHSTSEFRRCSAVNAIRLLLSKSADPKKKTLTGKILANNLSSFRSSFTSSEHFQLVFLSGIDEVVEKQLAVHLEAAGKLAANAVSMAAVKAEEKANSLALAAIEKKLEAMEGASPAGKNAVLLEKGDLESEKHLIAERKKKLEEDKKKITLDAEARIKRIDELLGFLESVQGDLRSLGVQVVFDHLRGKAAAYKLSIAGIDSLDDAAKFMSAAPRGTVNFIDGVGGPTAATNLPTVTHPDFATKGDGPGVSNTAPFDPAYRPEPNRTDSPDFDPAGKRRQRNPARPRPPRDESAVGGAQDAPGALPVPPPVNPGSGGGNGQ